MKSKFLKLYHLIMEEVEKNKNEISILDLTSQICQLIESDSELKKYIIDKKENNKSNKCQIIYQISNNIDRNEFMDKIYNICINSNLIDKSDIIKDEYSGAPNGFSFIKSQGCKKVILLNSIGFVAKGGGGTRKNSTINSNLTELIPCLLFYNNDLLNAQKIDQTFISKLIKIATDATPEKEIFINKNDQNAAIKTLNSINLSDKSHLTKIKSGIKIYNFITNSTSILKNYKIRTIWWCYRNKPENVSPSNPSDIIVEVEIKNKELKKYVGYSLKSGTYSFNKESNSYTETSFEPKKNTYVITLLKDYIEENPENKSLLNNFSKSFNMSLSEIFSNEGKEIYNINKNLPNFEPQKIEELDEWEIYKDLNKNELRKIDINNLGYRYIQKNIINFFIKNINNDQFKSFFCKKCLGIMPNDSSDWKYFINNGFFVIKANENSLNPEGDAFNITPKINANASFKVEEISNSIQSFRIKYNNKNYRISIRTCQGNGFLELPNLRFSVQDDKEDKEK